MHTHTHTHTHTQTTLEEILTEIGQLEATSIQIKLTVTTFLYQSQREWQVAFFLCRVKKKQETANHMNCLLEAS